MKMASLGTSEHADWLAAQLRRSRGTPQEASPIRKPEAPDHSEWLKHQIAGASSLSSRAPPASSASALRVASTDRALGTPRHAAWIEAQLAGARRGSSLKATPDSPPSPPPLPPPPLASFLRRLPPSPPKQAPPPTPPFVHARQPDVRLPAGVNAVLRGQDLSAQDDHEQWLEKQLARAASATSAARALQPPTPSGTSWLLPLEARREHHMYSRWLDAEIAVPTSPKYVSAAEDCALGSSRHVDWLAAQFNRMA